jgi:hypothetical protein
MTFSDRVAEVLRAAGEHPPAPGFGGFVVEPSPSGARVYWFPGGLARPAGLRTLFLERYVRALRAAGLDAALAGSDEEPHVACRAE